MAHSTSLNPYNYLEKVFVVPFSMERNRLHSSWGHGAAKRPSCLLNTALSDWETHARATVPHWEAQTATGHDTFSFSSPSQPLGSSRGHGGQQLLALTPCHITPTGSRSNWLRERTKAALLASSLETLTPYCISSPSDWLLPWQLVTHLCPIMSTQTTGPPVHFLSKRPARQQPI